MPDKDVLTAIEMDKRRSPDRTFGGLVLSAASGR